MDTLLVLGQRERALGLPDRILAAAMDYVLDDRVVDGVVLGEHVAARIIGARDDYRAQALPGDAAKASCSCGRRQPCRHAAAVALEYVRRPQVFVRLAQEDAPLAETVFRLVAGRAEPLAPLRAGETAAALQVPAFDWDIVGRLPASQAMERIVRWLEAAPQETGEERVAQILASLADTVRMQADLAGRVMRLYLKGGPGGLDSALGGLTHVLEGDALARARAVAERVLWTAVDETDGNWSERALARRAVAWLAEQAEVEGGPEAVAAWARAHPGVLWARVIEAQALARLGRGAEAAACAQAAYLQAHGDASDRLYALLVSLGQASVPGVAAFLRAAWEAAPSDTTLWPLLAMGDEAERARTRAAAVRTLTRHHRFDLLCRMARSDGDRDGAVRWALRDGRHAAPPDLCRTLAEDAADGQPLVAIELLGAAYRRLPSPDERRRVLARAQALGRRHADLGAGWRTLRRRWFPEGVEGQRTVAPPEAARPS